MSLTIYLHNESIVTSADGLRKVLHPLNCDFQEGSTVYTCNVLSIQSNSSTSYRRLTSPWGSSSFSPMCAGMKHKCYSDLKFV